MSQELHFSESLQQTVNGLHTAQRAKSARRGGGTGQPSGKKQMPVIEDNKPVGKFNLSPEYQHVKSQFMDTTKTVSKLRQQAQDQREELRRQKEIHNN